MTRNEIIEKYNELLSANGNLSHDDYITLGVMHRELPQNERNWEWLTVTTCYPNTAESYRALIKRYMKANKINVEVDTLPQSVNEIHELYKERQRLRDERTTLNRQLRDEARVERLRDSIVLAVEELKALPQCKYQGYVGESRAEAIAMLSDLHIGMCIDEYCNKYNLEIATKRLDKWVKDVIKYCKANDVVKLNVVNLGDLIHGDIHTTIRVEQEFDVITQVMQASELVSKALNELQKAAPVVVYRSCSDNHSRILPNKNESIEKENFFRLIDWYLEERLKDTNIEFAHDNLTTSMGKFRLMNGKLVMFAHGHLNKPNHSFQDFIGATGEYIHYVLLGHFHEERAKHFQNMRVLTNGSVCGTDQYAESIRKYTKPAQTLLIFDEDNLINHSINLDII